MRYEVMDVFERSTLSVESVGSRYVDGVIDLHCAIIDEDGREVAHKEFDECTSGFDVTYWARSNEFAMTDRAADFAERVIESALCYGEDAVDGAVSHILATFPVFAYPQFIDANGDSFDYETAVNLMDDDLREETNADLAPCSDQRFIEEYARRHEQRFGEPFTPFAGGKW